jgi:hypothetical protein
MKPILTFKTLVVGLVTSIALCGCGSGESDELSYAEALSIYNAELETLERLQAQRAKLQVQMEPSAGDMLGDLLGEASKFAGEYRSELKQSIEDVDDPAGSAAELDIPTVGENVLGELNRKLEGNAAVSDEVRAEIAAQIAKLDVEIAAQEERVARAKAERDAADVRRGSGE